MSTTRSNDSMLDPRSATFAGLVDAVDPLSDHACQPLLPDRGQHVRPRDLKIF